MIHLAVINYPDLVVVDVIAHAVAAKSVVDDEA